MGAGVEGHGSVHLPHPGADVIVKVRRTTARGGGA